MTDEETIAPVKAEPTKISTRPKSQEKAPRSSIRFKRTLSHSLWIAHKDLLEFSRNRVMLVMLFVFPLFMMIMTGYIFPTGNNVKDMPVGIVNSDNYNGTGHAGPESQMLVSSLYTINNNTHFFKYKSLGTYNNAKEKITRGEQNGAIIISANFTDNIRSNKPGYVTVLYDQSNPTISAEITGILNQLIDQIGTQHAVLQINRTTNLTIVQTKAIVKPYSISNKGTVPGDPSYFQFLAPGMMMMVVMMGTMSGLPRAIAYEKDSGTLDGVLAAPTSRFSIILGKVIAQSVRALIQGFVVLLLAVVLFGVTVHGSPILLVFMMFMGIYGFIGLGIMITSLASDEETASTIMMVLQFPMLFLSGVLFPIQQMPWYMQYVAKVMPLTYAAQAMRKVVVLGAGIGDIMTELIILFVFGSILLGLSIPLFKRAMTR